MGIDRIAKRRVVTAMAMLLLAVTLGGTPRPAPAFDVPPTNITTPEILAGTVAAIPSCLRWMPIGVCFWLRCSLFSGCSIETSVMVGHYNPDLVVGAYRRPGETPWVEMRSVFSASADPAARSLIAGISGMPAHLVYEGGDQAEDRFARDHTTHRFKEGDAVGHPAQLMDLGLDLSGMGIDYLCPSRATPFLPYFHSGLDALAWRWSIPEMFYPQALIPGLREIGQFPLWTWGAVYPRHGAVHQADDAKAGAVIAQRVGDIVTRNNQPHVYLPLGSAPWTWFAPSDDDDGGTTSTLSHRVWGPGGLIERDPTTGDWQMLAPRMTSSCEVFGSNDLTRIHSWGVGQTAEDRNYAWALWRPYRCCPRRGAFLFSVQAVPWP
jgi:integrating conjugative element protein (TIGR03756 family)